MISNHKASATCAPLFTCFLPVIMSPCELFGDHSFGFQRLTRFDDVEIGNTLQFLSADVRGKIFERNQGTCLHHCRFWKDMSEWIRTDS